MESKQRLTFDSLEVNDAQSHELLNLNDNKLVNEKYWINEAFSPILFKRVKRFCVDEQEIKNEFNLWHKELGDMLYCKEKQKFTLEKLPKNTQITEINNFLKLHPLLTKNDEKQLELAKRKVNDKYFKYSVMNTCIGFLVIMTYVRRAAKKDKLALSVVMRKNYFLTISLFLLSFIFLDLRFKLNKPFYYIGALKELGLGDKYFKHYL
jgi:hypothetical protein